ncbi:MAG TPA: hypothetical protein V6D50_02565 [Chroococcales cyanobacterium]
MTLKPAIMLLVRFYLQVNSHQALRLLGNLVTRQRVYVASHHEDNYYQKRSLISRAMRGEFSITFKKRQDCNPGTKASVYHCQGHPQETLNS